jgi:hypothetical protein
MQILYLHGVTQDLLLHVDRCIPCIACEIYIMWTIQMAQVASVLCLTYY